MSAVCSGYGGDWGPLQTLCCWICQSTKSITLREVWLSSRRFWEGGNCWYGSRYLGAVSFRSPRILFTCSKMQQPAPIAGTVVDSAGSKKMWILAIYIYIYQYIAYNSYQHARSHSDFEKTLRHPTKTLRGGPGTSSDRGRACKMNPNLGGDGQLRWDSQRFLRTWRNQTRNAGGFTRIVVEERRNMEKLEAFFKVICQIWPKCSKQVVCHD